MEYEQEFSWARSMLNANEYILWSGRPGDGHLITGQDAFAIPFSIFFLGFAVFWESMAVGMGTPGFFKFWGIPFIAMGLYLVFGRFLHQKYLRKRTEYVVTNQRILRRRMNKITMLPGSNKSYMRTTLYADGYGTIVFQEPMTAGYYRRNGFGWNSMAFTMECIPDANRVQELIRNMEDW